MELSQQIKKTFLTLLAVIILGILGFMLIEGWPFLDSLYMVVTTLSTVGYREVYPLTKGGVIFNVVFIILGVGAFLYVITTMAEYFIAGHLTGFLGRRKMNKKIEKLKGHYIICGFGRVGEQISHELTKEGVSFVVIDNNPQTLEHCSSHGFLFVEGNAYDDDVLKEAGILKAKGIVTVTDTDADNVYIILSAKSLNKNIFVVARANLEESEHKLAMAGADRVVSPYSIGGRRLASILIRPAVVEFLDVIMHSEELMMLMEEISVGDEASLVGKTLGKTNIKSVTGANILAIKKEADGKMIVNPASNTKINGGDLLIALGTKEQLVMLERLARAKKR